MIMLRLYNNKIKAAFESETAFALLHFKVKVVFPVLLIPKGLFFSPPRVQSVAKSSQSFQRGRV